jgi:hypothetical protein
MCTLRASASRTAAGTPAEMGVQSSARFTMTPIRALSGALAPFLSARDPDCSARENEAACAGSADQGESYAEEQRRR